MLSVPAAWLSILFYACVPTSAEDFQLPTDTGLPYPMAPPSEGFCSSNTLGDDTYISFFRPCEFKFYKSGVASDHFSCDGFDDSGNNMIVSESRKVFLWPDSCVAAGERCYSISEYPSLVNFTFYGDDPSFTMEFPSNATVISVDCSSDYFTAQEFMENLPENLPEYIDAVAQAFGKFAVGTFSFAVAFIIMGCCCCAAAFKICCFRRSQPEYIPIATAPLPSTTNNINKVATPPAVYQAVV